MALALMLIAYTCMGLALIFIRLVASKKWQEELEGMRAEDPLLGEIAPPDDPCVGCEP